MNCLSPSIMGSRYLIQVSSLPGMHLHSLTFQHVDLKTINMSIQRVMQENLNKFQLPTQGNPGHYPTSMENIFMSKVLLSIT